MKRILHRVALPALLATALADAAPRIEVEGLMPGAAVLLVDGERKLVREGQSFRGVTLVTARSGVATVDVEGQRQVLGLSQRITSNYAAPAVLSVNIQRDARLQYMTTAQINGRSVPVMIDTGANLVAMNESHARRLGVDLESGVPSRVETASGTAQAWRVNLHSVDVGGIVVNNVEAGVIKGDYPVTILLGMTYLQHVKIEEKQGIMTLSRHR